MREDFPLFHMSQESWRGESNLIQRQNRHSDYLFFSTNQQRNCSTMKKLLSELQNKSLMENTEICLRTLTLDCSHSMNPSKEREREAAPCFVPNFVSLTFCGFWSYTHTYTHTYPQFYSFVSFSLSHYYFESESAREN